MAHPFPSEPWAEAFGEAINANPRYAEAGRDWTHGAVALGVKADAALGIEQDMAILLDVHEGKCRSARYLETATARDEAAFVIEGTYDRWRTLIQEGLDPIKTLMQGKLRMTKGHLPTMIRYVESSKAMLASAQQVATEFKRSLDCGARDDSGIQQRALLPNRVLYEEPLQRPLLQRHILANEFGQFLCAILIHPFDCDAVDEHGRSPLAEARA